jgi:hypothetical protein
VPLQFFPFGGDFNVVAANAADSDLLGARVVAVDRKSIETLHSILRTFSGGPDAHRDLVAASVLASPNQLHAVGIGRSDDSVTYRLILLSGHIVEPTFKAESPASNGAVRVTIPSAGRASWAFQHPEQPFRWRDAPELEAVVIQLRMNVDADTRKIADFLEEAEADRVRLQRQNVVLDMRFNGGGNYMLTRDFMASWPARLPPPGRFFVLSSRLTMSAAIASIAYLKQAGGERVVLVGEQPGDRLMFFSEGRPIQLPNTGLFFRPTTARNDFHDGCRQYDDCFAPIAQPGHPAIAPPALGLVIERKPIAVKSLDPDIVAPWTAGSWTSGTDPAMDAIGENVRRAH